jgi:hypothetical protein
MAIGSYSMTNQPRVQVPKVAVPRGLEFNVDKLHPKNSCRIQG